MQLRQESDQFDRRKWDFRAIDNVFFDRSRYVHAYGNIYAVFFIFFFILEDLLTGVFIIIRSFAPGR